MVPLMVKAHSWVGGTTAAPGTPKKNLLLLLGRLQLRLPEGILFDGMGEKGVDVVWVIIIFASLTYANKQTNKQASKQTNKQTHTCVYIYI
jgi:hypothetical protein